MLVGDTLRKVWYVLLVVIIVAACWAWRIPVRAVPARPVAQVALPAAIDAPSFYEKQTMCQSVARPGSLALKQLLLDTYGPATIYITRACTGNVSEHFDGRAVDWMRDVRVAAEREQAEAFLAWLLAPAADGTPMEMARRLGIMYLIWNNRMIRSYDPGRGWTNYRGCMAARMAAQSHDTPCHRDHIHISLSWDGAAAATSWWTGSAQTLPYCSSAATRGAQPAPGVAVTVDLVSASGLVPVAATTVLDTASGAGLATPCRILAGRTLPIDVRSAIAGTDARVVALELTVRSNAPARLALWSSGRTRPTGQLELPMGSEVTATYLVPVSSAGTIALGTSLGAATVRARVVGYLTEDLPGASGANFPPPGRNVAGIPAGPGLTSATPESASTPGSLADATSQTSAPAGEVMGANQPPSVRASKPLSISAQVQAGVVHVSWQEPASIGSHPIQGYRVAALFSRTQTKRAAGSCATDAAGRSCTLTGLRKGRTYWLSLRVTTAAGSTWADKLRVLAK